MHCHVHDWISCVHGFVRGQHVRHGLRRLVIDFHPCYDGCSGSDWHGRMEAIKRLENSITQPGTDATTAFDEVRGETRLLLGAAELPARNVGTIGMLLYSEHLLAVEMAGTLLLVAAIGAVAIASRKGVSA